MSEFGRLYVVATPIGNSRDITLRALEILNKANAIICEEFRQGSQLINQYHIKCPELITLNEHNEQSQTLEIIHRLHQNQNLALISDCGTPVFADPGHVLIQKAVESGILVIPIPGPSSLMAALSILDIKLDKFVFGGFLPRKKKGRQDELKRLYALHMAIILMDTPYRLNALLKDVFKIFGKNQWVTLACDLTLASEEIYRGRVGNILMELANQKKEFILIIHPPLRDNTKQNPYRGSQK